MDEDMTKKRLRSIMGENIRKKRLDLNLTIEELAEMIGITPGFLNLIERGERGITPFNIYKLADIFGESTDTFYYHTFSESFTKIEALRKKVSCLITGFREDELNLIIHIIKGIRQMNLMPILNDDEF